MLLNFDELGFLLKMAAIKGQALDSMLNRLWGAPPKLDRVLSSRGQAGGARSVERPLVSLLAGTHVQTFWRNLEDPELAIGSGFVNRLAPFCVARGRSLPITREPDPQLAAAIRAHLAKLAALEPRSVSLTSTAERLWVEYSTEHDRRIGEFGYPKSAVVKRIRDHVARLALVFATDAGRLQIDTADLLGSIEVGAFIEASYVHLLDGRAPGRGPERAVAIEERVLRLMRRAPIKTWTRREPVLLAWNGSERPSAEELSRALRHVDEIDSIADGRRTKYRLVDPGPRSTGKSQPTLGNSVDRGPVDHASEGGRLA